MSKFKVGFVGLGLMGLPMAKNVLKNKYPLIVWNRSPKNLKEIKKFGAEVCKNLIDLPNKCQVIIMMLVNDKVCLEIAKVLKKNLNKDQILIDMSSTKKETAIEIEKIISQILHFEDIIIEVVGSWIWLSGSTKAIKSQIKDLGFKWATKKKMWYYGEMKGKSPKQKSMNDIKSKYGCTTLKGIERVKLTG